MAHNIIEGINTVIKGLEMIKVELISKGAQEDVAVKVANILAGGAVQEEKVEIKAEKPSKAKAEATPVETPVETATPDETDNVEVDGDRQAELEAMSYNDIKALVSSLGGKAVGNKAKLIGVILDLEAQGDEVDGEDEENEDAQADEPASEEVNAGEGKSDVEESSSESAEEVDEVEEEEAEEEEAEEEEVDSENVEEFKEFLDDLALEEVEEIADELGIDFGVELKKKDRKKVTEKCLANIDKLTVVLEELGYYDEEEDEEEVKAEEVEDDSEDLADIAEELGLNEMEIDELADILNEHDLSTKGKKQALIDRILKAIEDGIIVVDEEEEEEEEAPAPKKGGSKGSKK